MSTRAAGTAADTFRELTRERRVLAEWEPEILRTQIEISQIAAPGGQEHERAERVAARFRASGYDVHFDDAGNVVARPPGPPALRPIVVCAHLDTVFPAGTDVTVGQDGHRLIGPGICDNARGLAAMLALAAVTRAGPRLGASLEFVATTGEEGAGDLRGAKHYFAHREPAAAAVVLDGAGDERIVNTALGSRRCRVFYRGPGGHSWSAFGMPNPVHAAARAANALADVRLPAGSTLTVSRIGGGLSVNAIPEAAWIEVDIRSTSEAVLARLEHEIDDVVAWAAARENDRRARAAPAMTYDIERIGRRPGGETPADTPLVVAAMEATRLIDRQPDLAVSSTDANAAIAAGVPAIAIGAGGRGGDTHSSREWFDGTGATAGVERALTIVAAMARLAAD